MFTSVIRSTGDSAVVEVDGKFAARTFASSVSALKLLLKDGQHSLRVTIQDKSGEVIAESKSSFVLASVDAGTSPCCLALCKNGA